MRPCKGDLRLFSIAHRKPMDVEHKALPFCCFRTPTSAAPVPPPNWGRAQARWSATHQSQAFQRRCPLHSSFHCEQAIHPMVTLESGENEPRPGFDIGKPAVRSFAIQPLCNGSSHWSFLQHGKTSGYVQPPRGTSRRPDGTREEESNIGITLPSAWIGKGRSSAISLSSARLWQ